ncbi:hypothetical protein ACN6LM_000799 [Streptomyces sp. SAS_281]|uniref:hypothetical protein n=1 Tax=Streptomyces sp. SAS_281 TaxID=3412744 RepID=UPI00403C2C2F
MTRIRLGAEVTASLDRNVPRIGAPVAWQAGYDGCGVKVAVPDSGIGATPLQRPDDRLRVRATAGHHALRPR